MVADSARIAFVVATKDRPKDIRQLLVNIAEQSYKPDQIIIVDASSDPVSSVVDEFPQLNLTYILHQRPSASAQRNAGIAAIAGDIDLVGFLDDDVILETGALDAIMQFWAAAPDDLGGCAFNLRNFVPTGGEKLKHSYLSNKLGLYSNEKGIVMPTGWQTMTGTLTETTFVQWLPIGASIWRKAIFDKFRFEEYFDEYSYLEDLDFSFSVSKYYKLAIIAEAGFYHYHSPSGRISSFNFGKIEVRNRLFFVRKHGRKTGFGGGNFIRLFMTIAAAVKGMDNKLLQRAFGNLSGLFQSAFPGPEASLYTRE